MTTTTARGIFWIDGLMRIGEQMALALKGGWADLPLRFSWRFTKPAQPGFPPRWPLRQTVLDFDTPQTLWTRLRAIFRNLWTRLRGALQPWIPAAP